MAINYSTLGTKLGKLIKKDDSLVTLAKTTLPADLQEIVAAYGSGATGFTTAQNAIEGIHAAYAGLAASVNGMRETIASYAISTLTDYDTVVSEIAGLDTQSLSQVLYALITDFEDNGQSVEKSVVSISSVSAHSRNVGNHTVLLDDVLDSFNSPTNSAVVHHRYLDKKSQFPPPSVLHVFECVSDSYHGGTSEGQESLAWMDQISFTNYDQLPEGIGRGPNITLQGGQSTPTNPTLSTFTSNVPTGWTLTNGTANINCIPHYAHTYRASACVQLRGDASTPKVTLRQTLRTISPGRRYCISLRAKTVSTPTSGYLRVKVLGDDWQAMPAELINVQASTITTDWTLYHVFFNTPSLSGTPAYMELSLEDLVDTSSVLVTDLFLMPAVYHGGIAAAAVPGTVPAAVHDQLYATVTNTEGLFQSFFRRFFNVQLPYATSSETTSYFTFLPTSLHTTTNNATWTNAMAS